MAEHARPSAGASRTGGGEAQRRRLLLERLEPRHLLAVLSVEPGGPFASVQAAVDHAKPGDVVLIAGGTYAESVNLSRMGSAVGGGPGLLTLRGSAAGAVLRSPSGPAVFNSAPFAGSLLLEQLEFRAPATAPASAALVLSGFQGRLEVVDAVFREVAGGGIAVQQFQGDLTIRDTQFLNVGSGPEHHAIQLRNWSGRGVIAGSTIHNAAASGIWWDSSAAETASLMIRDNQIRGGATSGMRSAVSVRLAGSTRSDLTIDNNQIEHLADAALDVIARGTAALHTRWTHNEIANVRGPVSNRLLLQDQAQGSAAIVDNAILDTAGDGLVLEARAAARLDAVLEENVFLSVGGALHGRGLVLSTAAGASGTLRAALEGNSFVDVEGTGLLIAAGGSSHVSAQVADSFFGDVGRAEDFALRAEQTAAQSSARLQLKLTGNTVQDSAGGGYGLQQRGSAPLLLEGTAAFPEALIATTNAGGPIQVGGAVQLTAPGALAPSVPQLVEGRVWQDLDGDGVQDSAEPGLADMALELTGSGQDGTPIGRQTQTDGSGRYLFAGLFAGDYQVQITVPSAYRLSPRGQGQDAANSDFDTATARAAVQLTAGGSRPAVDAGLMPTWQNPRDRLDVNGDRLVTPLDALIVINDINDDGIRPLQIPPRPPVLPPPYPDVDGNGSLTPADVLHVVNYLNGLTPAGQPGGEGEAPVAAAAPAAAAAWRLSGRAAGTPVPTHPPTRTPPGSSDSSPRALSTKFPLLAGRVTVPGGEPHRPMLSTAAVLADHLEESVKPLGPRADIRRGASR